MPVISRSSIPTKEVAIAKSIVGDVKPELDHTKNLDNIPKQAEQVKPARKLDFTKLKMSTAKQQPKIGGDGGIMTVVNSKSNGRRLMFPKKVYEWLGEPEQIQLSFDDNEMLVLPVLVEGSPIYNLKRQGGKYIVYCYELVTEVSAFFELTFEDKVCVTLSTASFETDEEGGQGYVVIPKTSTKTESTDDSGDVELDHEKE